MSARVSNIAPDARSISIDAHAAMPTLLPPLRAGTTAVYPGQGPCRIGHTVKKIVEGQVMMFYHLTVLNDRGGELFVPVEKALAIGLRLPITKAEVPRLLAHLKKGARPADNWRQRATENLKLLNTGSAFDEAEVVASLTQLRDTRPLTLSESGTLGKAKKLLVCEISEVMGESRTAVEEQLDLLLTEKLGISLTEESLR